FETRPVALRFGGATAATLVHFSPGRGVEIDAEVARIVASAQRRVRVCSMLLNSGHFINALQHVMQAGRAQVSGIYDRTQMQSVVRQWGDVPHNTWKISAVEEIVRDARLVGKNSTPYSPEGTHDFMHNKVLVVDDTVISGSYNFSNSAEMNAENILVIASPALAETYSQYTDRLMRKYAGDSVGRLL
ncbi:MAG TPA: phospholipase D-like domain-containing protein, partial [Ktedonobacterales bacterium]|nr:phospholipase D-like domain-containing protein [Ktedonobacterales bacterium]